MFLTLVDFFGCFAFALSGGTRAVERRLDPFGVMFLAFIAATFGGIIRDVIIGSVPPVAFDTWHYFAISCAAGLACIFANGLIAKVAAPVAVFDALGLGLYVVVGTRKAMDAGLSPLMAAVLGMVNAIGGGIGRDILAAQTPMVLHKEIYALAALLGALVVAYGDYYLLPSVLVAIAGSAVAILLRLAAMRWDWNLPPVAPK
ncbi:trimeric intracellular cation channel family protein [Pleomorphomonas koreensis]|uniref:trimeric intracellular cation channel family protein n=1 Tax=Pleomorphomonas koreensis TaxID=257440 RepID=UPI000403B8BD|nr:trimeric intracellular cation channel family protein [Pleomorphomonas koreensis]